MMINGYFTIMSIYGWCQWTKKTNEKKSLSITRTNNNEKVIGIALFLVTIFVVFGIYNFFDYEIKKDNYIDIFASGIFFTAMGFMALKKIENWTMWINGDIIVVTIKAKRCLGKLGREEYKF